MTALADCFGALARAASRVEARSAAAAAAPCRASRGGTSPAAGPAEAAPTVQLLFKWRVGARQLGLHCGTRLARHGLGQWCHQVVRQARVVGRLTVVPEIDLLLAGSSVPALAVRAFPSSSFCSQRSTSCTGPVASAHQTPDKEFLSCRRDSGGTAAALLVSILREVATATELAR